MPKRTHRLLDLLCLLLAAGGLVLLTHWADAALFSLVARAAGKRPQVTWPGYLNSLGLILLLGSAAIWLTLRWIIPYRGPIWRGLVQVWQLRKRLAEPEVCYPPWRWTWVDGLVLTVFVLYAGVLFLNKIQGPYPYIKQPSDAGNIASFAAAMQHPELFRGDELLGDPDNLRSYATLNIPILNGLERLAGNYALAFAWFIMPQTVLNLVGFYLLGLTLFRGLPLARRRAWAFLLTVVLAVPYEINLLETWGIVDDPVTRFTFQALLPYLLVLILRWRHQPRRWPVIALLAGLMAFVHPVSTPAWVAAIWLGMLALLPRGWSLRKKALVMVGLGALTVAALSPYALTYLGAGGKPKTLSYDLFIEVITQHFPPNILDIRMVLVDFLTINAESGLLPVALLFTAVLLWLPWRDRTRLNLALLWLAGILLVSLLVPWVEHAIEQAYRIVPLETELARGMRYVVFFMLLFSVWALAELDRRLGSTPWRNALLAIGLALTAGWLLVANTAQVWPDQLVSCLRQGQVLCVHYDDEDQVIQALRERTPPGAPILATFADWGTMSYSMPIRYQAQRPLVFAYKDRGQLVTARSAGLAEWYTRLKAVNRLNRKESTEERLDGFVTLARQWGARYVLANFKAPEAALRARNLDVVYENDTFVLIRVP